MKKPPSQNNKPAGKIISFPQVENEDELFLKEKREFYLKHLKHIINKLEQGENYDNLIIIAENNDELDFISVCDSISMLGLLEMAKLQLIFADMIDEDDS